MDHVRALLRISHGVFGDVCLHAAQLQVIRSIQHAAVCVAAGICKRGDVLLCRRAEHDGRVHPLCILLCEHGLGNFGAEVAEVHAERVAALLFEICKRLSHLHFALDDAHGALVDIALAVLLLVRSNERLAAVHGKAFGEAVAAHRHDAHFHFGNVLHNGFLLLVFKIYLREALRPHPLLYFTPWKRRGQEVREKFFFHRALFPYFIL